MFLQGLITDVFLRDCIITLLILVGIPVFLGFVFRGIDQWVDTKLAPLHRSLEEIRMDLDALQTEVSEFHEREYDHFSHLEEAISRVEDKLLDIEINQLHH